jgi:PAS domain S-box-containing protein
MTRILVLDMGSSEFTSTQKVRIQKDLRSSEERFRIIVEQTGQLVYDYNVLTGLISWAGAVEPITGYSSEEFKAVGIQDWEAMIHPEDRERVMANLEVAQTACSSFHMEYRFQRKDRSYIYVEDHGIFQKNQEGKAFQMLGVMSDATSRVESQEALRRSEELYRSLAEASSHMVWMSDAQGEVSMDMKAWPTFTGQRVEQMAGFGWAEAIHSEDFPVVMENWQRSLRDGSSYQDEYRLKRHDGVYRLMSVKAVPVRDSKGQIRNWIGTCLDISEQRESEKRQTLLEAQLRQSQKMEAIGTLAGGVAHDFNNILMAIIFYAELAHQEAVGQPTQTENIQHILEAADRARDLVKQILSFSRQTRQETHPVYLNEVTKEALKLLKAALSSQIEINVRYEEGLPAILADPTQMQQVVLNLCTNAAHALKDKGGCLDLSLSSLDLRDSRLAERHRLTPGFYVMMQVADDGVGMDEETAKRIFDPFFTTKGPGEGTGLGLSVVHGIVKAHQGAIEVRSTQGKGTCFDLYFPAVYGTEEFSAKRDFQPARGEGQKILIVDDEIKICRSFCRILERLGYWTEFSIRPVQAWEMIEKDPSAWDLIITDLTMPGMTGIQLAEKIHALRPQLPILLVTGYSGSWTQAQLAEKGITEMMAKPISIQSLAAVVATTLEASRSVFPDA